MTDGTVNLPDPFDDSDDDEISKVIRAKIAEHTVEDDPGDEIEAFGDDPPDDRIPADAGMKIIERQGARPTAPKESESNKPESQPEAEAEAEAEAEPETDATDDLAGLPEDRAMRLRAQLDEARAVTDLFKGREAEMRQHGASVADVVKRFLHLHDFAQKRPDEYLAWVAQQSGGENAAEVLNRAAERLGYKVTKVEDDDPFEDDEVKQLRAENRRLKGEQPWGPDAYQPENDPSRIVQEFVASRPLFAYVKDEVARLALAKRNETGRAVTVDELGAIYDQAVQDMRARLGVQPAGTSAAQASASVAQRDSRAAAVEKAKAASKSVGGSGQGASRELGLPDNAPLVDVIRHFAARAAG